MIELSYCGGQYFIWNIQDISKLRNDYRIVGELVGSPAGSKQNINNINLTGLPLRLSVFEVMLGLEFGFLELKKEEKKKFEYEFSYNFKLSKQYIIFKYFWKKKIIT